MENRLLIVDDEKAILKSFGKLFTSAGFKVHTSETKDLAKTLLTRFDYQAVIVDWGLTGLTGIEGFEVIRYAKDHNPATKTVLISGYGNYETRNQAFKLGADLFFQKPVSGKHIRIALKGLGVC